MPPPDVVPQPDPARLDLRIVFETLRGGKATDAWLEEWVPSTWAAPERFRDALYTYASTRRNLKSRPGAAYDVYHDCVTAHVGQRRPAIVVAGASSDAEITFDALHHRCTALAAAWMSAGVEPGQVICVVLPMGIELAVAILTAFRLGAVVSMLPPLGATFVRGRLEALAPDRVVTSERHQRMIGRFAEIMLPTAPERVTRQPGSHAYAADEPAARLWTPFGEGYATPVELTGGALHEGLMRDGLLVFCLDATDTLAAPGFDPIQFQPHLLLTALTAGATYAECSVDDLAAQPKLLERLGVTVLGIHRTLREQMIQRGDAGFGPAVRAWFRSLTEVLAMDRWDELTRGVLKSPKVHGFNVVVNAASGGTHIFSPRLPAAPSLRAWPVPGRTWQISEVAAGALPALNDTGVYTPLIDEEPDASMPRLIMSRAAGGFVVAGTIDAGPDAQTYPAAEVEQIVERHPGVRHAAAILAPGRWMNDARTVLLVFVDDARGPDGRFASPVALHEITSLITREIGARWSPDRIEIYPLRPRLVKGVVDRAWCRSQYLRGALNAKARSEVFVLLSRLGYILAGAPPPK